MPTMTTSLGRIAYDSRGSGPVVVLLPSGAHERRDYDEVRDLLPEQVRSIGVDWPGHGESPAWSNPVDEPVLARLVEEILELLAPEGAVVAGNSIGGNVAARLAVKRPDLVRGLMLIDAGGFEGPLQPAGRVFLSLMSRPWFLRAVYPAFSWWYMRPRTDADRRARSSAIAATRSSEGRTVVAQMWHGFSLADHDVRAQAKQITTPTTVVQGRKDPVIRMRVGKAVHDLIKGSKLVVIDTGHVPHTTNPTAVAAVLVALLGEAFPAVRPTGDTGDASAAGKDGQR